MQTQIIVRHFDAQPMLRDYALKRLSKLERFYDGITDARIVLSTEPHGATEKAVEISLNVYRQHLSARDIAATYEEAIDQCVERLRRQVLKYKAKMRSKDKNVHR